MIRRILLVLAALGALLVVQPSAAGAQTDGYTPMNVTATVLANGDVRITGENCNPGEPVTYSITNASGRLVAEGETLADAAGAFAFTVSGLPNGTYSAAITCGDNTTVLAFKVGRDVVASPPRVNTPQQRPLAFTGSDALPLARLGLVLLASGGVAVYAAKKRKGRQAAFLDG